VEDLTWTAWAAVKVLEVWRIICI